jgi:hypothetical protein
MMTTPSGAIYFLGSVYRKPPLFAWRVLSGCITLTFRSGDDGIGHVMPLIGGVALEVYALSVCGSIAGVMARKVEI